MVVGRGGRRWRRPWFGVMCVVVGVPAVSVVAYYFDRKALAVNVYFSVSTDQFIISGMLQPLSTLLRRSNLFGSFTPNRLLPSQWTQRVTQ